MNEDNATGLLLSEGAQNDVEPKIQKNRSKFQKPYVFYCIMTVSVMLFTLAFAASEIFALFFSDGDIGNIILTKLFGADAAADNTLKEIMLGQSFADLSFGEYKETTGNIVTTTLHDTTENVEDTTNAASMETENTTSGKNHGTVDIPKDIYEYYPDSVPVGMKGVLPIDIGLSEYGNGYIYNQSSFDPDTDKLGDISVSVSPDKIYPSGAPLVLIIHTHGTEGYTDEGVTWYDPEKEIARSSDVSKNVVYIGKIISDFLNGAGIATLHCEIMHDAEGYSGSYERSAETIKKYLAEYPSIQYVIDVHRDAIVRSTGELVRPVVPTENGAAAQVMCVVGSGGKGSEVVGWERNLALAQRLREKLNSDNSSVCRPTCLRDSAYNQQYSNYALLLEMGAAGNSLSEAEESARLVAKALTAIIYE